MFIMVLAVNMLIKQYFGAGTQTEEATAPSNSTSASQLKGHKVYQGDENDGVDLLNPTSLESDSLNINDMIEEKPAAKAAPKKKSPLPSDEVLHQAMEAIEGFQIHDNLVMHAEGDEDILVDPDVGVHMHVKYCIG
mmetsp:Transcript_9447/g.14497  ORF Transcript_9447/g.14497 Transcript_9447/m.14497 type:complete len:136 (+) Transcript_9447:34-441(+)